MNTEPTTAEMLDRLPPQDLDSEKGVLGSILLRGSMLDAVASILKPDDFYADANQKLYAAMLAMHDANQGIDVTLLANHLRVSGEFEAVGGNAYIAEVVQLVPVAAHAVYYAKLVKRRSVQRAILHAGTELVRDAYDDGEPEQLLDRAESLLSGIGDTSKSDEPTPVAEAVVAAMDRIDSIRERGLHIGCYTGIEPIDEHFGGLFPGEFIIMAARPGMGKTSLALQIADWIARSGRWVYFVSLEMSAAVLSTRLLCMHAGVSSQLVRKGGNELTSQHQSDLTRVSQPYATAKMVIHDKSETTMTSIRRWARRLHRKHGLALLVLDYLQLVNAEDSRVPRHEQVGKQSKMLKGLAVELDIPVLCVCQLNRESTKADSTFPKISQLRESGNLEQDCDVGMVIRKLTKGEREKQNVPEVDGDTKDTDARTVVLDIQKNRNGAEMTIMLDWTPAHTRFGRRFEDDYTDPTEGKGWQA